MDHLRPPQGAVDGGQGESDVEREDLRNELRLAEAHLAERSALLRDHVESLDQTDLRIKCLSEKSRSEVSGIPLSEHRLARAFLYAADGPTKLLRKQTTVSALVASVNNALEIRNRMDRLVRSLDGGSNESEDRVVTIEQALDTVFPGWKQRWFGGIAPTGVESNEVSTD